jgi:hypothetical protein
LVTWGKKKEKGKPSGGKDKQHLGHKL